MKTKLLLIALAAVLFPAVLPAAVPASINYQGRLTDAQGAPVTGNRTLAVKIYDAATGGNVLYAETIGAVAVKGGLYSFQFGAAGSTTVETTQLLATTDGKKQVFSATITGTPQAGTLSLTDGSYLWSQAAGSSNADQFGVTYNTGTKRLTIVYYEEIPPAGRAISATHSTLESHGVGDILTGPSITSLWWWTASRNPRAPSCSRCPLRSRPRPARMRRRSPAR